MTENQKQQTLARSLIQGSLWLCVEGPQHRGEPNNLKKWKWINEQNTKEGEHGHKGVEECEREGSRGCCSTLPLLIKIWPSLCCSVGRRVFNVPLSWQLRPQCWCTFLEDHYSRSSTWPPPACPQHTSALSRPLLLLFLASLSYFSCVFFCCCTFCVLLFFFSSTPPPMPFHWSSSSVIEVHWTESLRGTGGFFCQLGFRAGFILTCHFTRPQVCDRVEQLWTQLSGPAHGLLWTGGKVQVCRAFFSQPDAAQEQIATRGVLLGQQNRRLSTVKENATQCVGPCNMLFTKTATEFSQAKAMTLKHIIYQ